MAQVFSVFLSWTRLKRNGRQDEHASHPPNFVRDSPVILAVFHRPAREEPTVPSAAFAVAVVDVVAATAGFVAGGAALLVASERRWHAWRSSRLLSPVVAKASDALAAVLHIAYPVAADTSCLI